MLIFLEWDFHGEYMFAVSDEMYALTGYIGDHFTTK